MKSIVVDSPTAPSEIGVMVAETFEPPTRCGAGEALGVLCSASFDVVFLDQTRMDRDAVDVCASIRQEHEAVSIMVVNDKVPCQEIVRGLAHGADDYILKPVTPRELSARVRALLRRARLGNGDHLRYHDLDLDLRTRVAARGDHAADLTSCEFSLLYLLMKHPEDVVTRATINQTLWGNGSGPSSNSIEAHICSLRRKIDRPGMERLIITVPRRGYRLGPARQDARPESAAVEW